MADHTDLIETLKEFFTLLYDLTFLTDKSELLFPSPSTGLLPIFPPIPSHIADAAIAGGISKEVLDLIPRLPQLRESCHDGCWVLYSTYMRTFLYEFLEGEDYDQKSPEDWKDWRQICERPNAEDERDMYWDGNILQLTYTNIYGYLLGYNVDTGLLIPWRPFEGEDRWRDVPASLPSEVFRPWIEKYRDLTWLVEGDGTANWSMEEDPRWEGRKSSYDSDSYIPRWRRKEYKSRDNEARFKQRVRIWKAKRKLRDIYVECGWDVHAVGAQTAFNRDEFLRRRKEYWEEVIEPMEALEWRTSSRPQDREPFTEEEWKALLADDLDETGDELDTIEEADAWEPASESDGESDDSDDLQDESDSDDYDFMDDHELEDLEAESREAEEGVATEDGVIVIDDRLIRV